MYSNFDPEISWREQVTFQRDDGDDDNDVRFVQNQQLSWLNETNMAICR